jgi:hypothetical protein
LTFFELVGAVVSAWEEEEEEEEEDEDDEEEERNFFCASWYCSYTALNLGSHPPLSG